MNKKVKALWVASLRDGSFKKGKYQLRDLEDCYDASGVLCELAVSAGIIDAPKRYDKPDAQVFFGYQYGDPKTDKNRATGIPEAVQKWADISYRTAYRIAMMGDSGKTFNQIADYIEKEF